MPLELPVPIATERLLLRPVQQADLPDLLVVNADDEVTRFLPYASWQSLDDGTAWLGRVEAQHAAGTGLQLVMADKVSGRVLGTCLLFRFDAGSQRAELGYVLGRASWGQGLMREALQALLATAFGSMALRRLEAEADPRNLASNRVLQQLGFAHEGLLRQRWMGKTGPVDTNIYGLLRGEWRAEPV
ncbi:MAG TPA: GNAT family protein [Ideonella sp.]|nr:GNAT family protein [Ideonella sp.]